MQLKTAMNGANYSQLKTRAIAQLNALLAYGSLPVSTFALRQILFFTVLDVMVFESSSK
jgi:hypothetical protein